MALSGHDEGRDRAGGAGVARKRREARGQAAVLMALILVVLCGGLALAVDVGLTTARQTSLQDAADNAAHTGAYILYGGRVASPPHSMNNASVWSAMVDTLTQSNLTVNNAGSGNAGLGAGFDPCAAAGYTGNGVALRAQYLDQQNTPIPTLTAVPAPANTTPAPANAWGVLIHLGSCQPAVFGGVIGHPRYTQWVDAHSGNPPQGPTSTSTPATPTSTATTTATSTPQPTATETPAAEPYAISGSPNGNCAGGNDTSQNQYPPGATPGSDEYYCVGAYDIASGTPAAVFWANGVGHGNNFSSHDASMKGYIGLTDPALGTSGSVDPGGGNNGPCITTGTVPEYVRLPIIANVAHKNGSEDFIVIATVVVHVDVTDCSHNSAYGTIAYVISDPYHIVTAPPTPTATSLPTDTPTATPTSTPVPTDTPIPPI